MSDLLEGSDNEGTAKSSASEFMIDDNSKLLNSEDKEYFHSMVGKVLHLAKRMRPDVLVSVTSTEAKRRGGC